MLQSASMEHETRESGRNPELKSHGKRLELIGKIADILLIEGVAQIPLRDLAKRLGTSDRMLFYYFEDKADLVHAAIVEVSSRLGAVLAASFPDDRRTPVQVLNTTAQLLASPAFSPFVNVWADISARGGRGEEPFQTIARQSVKSWLEWLDTRLAVPDAASRRSVASALLVVMEGVRLLESAAPGAASGVTEFLSGSFATPNR
jgi:AcrR family transcriptional regulator